MISIFNQCNTQGGTTRALHHSKFQAEWAKEKALIIRALGYLPVSRGRFRMSPEALFVSLPSWLLKSKKGNYILKYDIQLHFWEIWKKWIIIFALLCSTGIRYRL